VSEAPRIRETSEDRVLARIERAVKRARLLLAWEAVWPRIAPILALIALFLALSWFGLWRVVPDLARWAILAALAVAALWFLFRRGLPRWPSRADALARVEAATGTLHRPATAFADRQATGAGDPAAEALWTAHRNRLVAALARLRTGRPRPDMASRDPYALRFVPLLLLVVAFVIAGPERGDRITEAFRGGEPTAVTLARIDAWVTPPAYTSRPPIFLTGERARAGGSAFSVPTGSVVTIRTGGTRDLDVVVADDGSGPVAAPPSADAAALAPDPPLERGVKLTRPATVAIERDGRQVAAWTFKVEPDDPPSVRFARPPAATASGALSLVYAVKDDYGVVSGSAEIAPVDPPAGRAAARPLVAAPKVPLSLPQARTRDGSAETIRDLTSHPWAGAKVRVTLVVRDEAGQEGRSQPAEIVLPARNFTNPLARAVVEQRGNLALDANAAPEVADGLDALTLAPGNIDKTRDYLALRSAYFRLLNARGDDDLRAEVDYLWSIALGIEDGDMSIAEQELRAAQDALRKALESNASDEEIKQLTAELRQAMQKYLQALAEEMRRNPQSARLPPDADVRTLRSEDLQKMLDQIEKLAESGARDAAKQMLSQLQNMLENLQAGRPQQGDEQSRQMMQALNDLADMIQKQQKLMDQTFQSGRGQGPDGKPMTRQELEQALKQLQEGQEGLQQQLQALMDKLRQQGMEPGGKLGQAGEAMGRAAGQLGKGKPGHAVGEQGSALDALRQGAQGLAQQFANRNGQGGGIRGGDQFSNQDPLGRPQRTTGPDLGASVKVPDEIDVQRAREILDAIRKKLGEAGQSVIERDYLERLLERF
jgi:uncharacterized protein (TIGR02302 family)